MVALGLVSCSGRKKVAVCSLAIKRAFDQVLQEALLACLLRRGVPLDLIRLLHSYLCDRQQCVRVGDVLSDSKTVISGVAQGSVLGPYLYAAYVDSIFDVQLSEGASSYVS